MLRLGMPTRLTLDLHSPNALVELVQCGQQFSGDMPFICEKPSERVAHPSQLLVRRLPNIP
jgi:hypothetical protein